MKKVHLAILIVSALIISACNQTNPNEINKNADEVLGNDAVEASENNADKIAGMAAEGDSVYFGKIIEAGGAISIEEFVKRMEGEDTLYVKIEAIASEVCQKKGCWMKVETTEGKSMRIRFKDYGFFVPKDISGRSVVFEGIAFKDTISVEDLKHYAEDEGQSEEEIAEITEPEIKTSFLANGVLIR